jgi:predicted DNA-binding transcriptional regulator AlpA
MTEDDKLITIQELCEIVGLKPQAARNLYKKQGLPVVRLTDSIIRFKLSAVKKWIEDRNVVCKKEDDKGV